jgi:hypothetical protein
MAVTPEVRSVVLAAQAGDRTEPRPSRWWIGAAAIAVIAWTVLTWAVSIHTFRSHSDSANAILAGRDMARGNLLLRGWALPSDSYWTIDIVLFALWALVRPVGPAAAHAVPLVIAAGIVALGMWLTCSVARSRPAAWMAAALVAGTLALPQPFWSMMFLQGPWHVGTTLWCLGAFILLRDRHRPYLWWPGCLLLATAVVGDPLALAIGVGPVLAAGAVTALRRRNASPLLWGALACAVTLCGSIVLSLARHRAGYTTLPADFSTFRNWTGNLRQFPHLLAGLLGFGSWAGFSAAGTRSPAPVERLAHVLGAAVLAGGVALTLARAVAGAFTGDRRVGSDGDVREDWLDAALLAGFAGSIAAYAVIAAPGIGFAGGRYLPPTVAFGALAGARGLAATRRPRWVPLPLVAAIPAVLLAVYTWGPRAIVSGPLPGDPESQLAGWLAGNDLTYGYGSYWVASDLVVVSRDRVVIRPVIVKDDGIHGFAHYASRVWFDDGAGAGSRARFVVTRQGDGSTLDTAAERFFGRPAQTTDVGPFRVMVWDGAAALRLTGPPTL